MVSTNDWDWLFFYHYHLDLIDLIHSDPFRKLIHRKIDRQTNEKDPRNLMLVDGSNWDEDPN